MYRDIICKNKFKTIFCVDERKYSWVSQIEKFFQSIGICVVDRIECVRKAIDGMHNRNTTSHH
jgi:hypothetical protein